MNSSLLSLSAFIILATCMYVGKWIYPEDFVPLVIMGFALGVFTMLAGIVDAIRGKQ